MGADRLIDNPDLRGRIKGLEVPFQGPMAPSPLLLGWMLEKRELSLSQNVTKLQTLSKQLIKQIGDFINGQDSLSPYDRERRWNKLKETGVTGASSDEIINPIYFQKRTMRSDLSFCPTVATSTKTTSPTISTSTVSSSSTLDQRTDQMPQPAGTF